MRRWAAAVVDLGFGDAGKGHLTDFLVRGRGATAVVRFNGGAQAGHTVVTDDGRAHTFAQLGAGSFVPGVASFLSRHVVVDPLALEVEAARLCEVGVADALARLFIHPRALVATPYHQALNQARERARGAARHGSCGVGFGETVADAERHPDDALRAGDLADAEATARRLSHTAERLRGELAAVASRDPLAARLFEDTGLPAALAARYRGLASRVSIPNDWEACLRTHEGLVFEGAQGVLICEKHGFAPHTTWSRCDFHNAEQVCGEAGLDVRLQRVGALRALAIRHGPGPFPTEEPVLSRVVDEPHNRDNPWQGPVRYGWFDAVLGRYAIRAVGGIDALALTHLDTVLQLPAPRLCRAYGTPEGHLTALAGPALPAQIAPELSPFSVAAVEDALGVRVAIESRGPRPGDVEVVKRSPSFCSG